MNTEVRAAINKIAIVSAIGLTAMVAVAAYGWFNIPGGDLIAMHWGINGQPDGYGPKAVALLALPLVMLIVTPIYIISIREKLTPDVIKKAAPFMYALWGAVLALMTMAESLIVMNALGHPVQVAPLMMMGVGVLFNVAGIGIAKYPEISSYIKGDVTPFKVKLSRYTGIAMCATGVALITGVIAQSLPFCVLSLLAGIVVILAIRACVFLEPRSS